MGTNWANARSKGRRKTKGVFCLEDDWWGTMKVPSSVEPILHLLNQWHPFYVPYIHRNTATQGAIEYYLQKWTQKQYAGYPILYFALHASPGELHIGDKRRARSCVTLDGLEEQLEGKCAKRIIFFAGCGALDVHGKRLNRFVQNTGALAICGYTAEVNWLRAAAFELMVFAAMQDNALTIAGAKAMKRRIKSECADLCKQLKFRMIIKTNGTHAKAK